MGALQGQRVDTKGWEINGLETCDMKYTKNKQKES